MNEEIIAINEKISKLWGAFRELAADYWGPDRGNGVRSEVKRLAERFDALEKECRHYVDAERRETCYGVEALEEYKKAIAKEKAERAAELAKSNEGAEAVEVEKIKANSATTVQILTLIGVVIGPAIVKVVEHFFK